MNERWREREGEEVRNMEQMHGRGGEEHTHMRTCISHTYTHIHTHTHTHNQTTHCIQLDPCKVYLCFMKTGSDGSPSSWSRYLKRIVPMDPILFGRSPGYY